MIESNGEIIEREDYGSSESEINLIFRFRHKQPITKQPDFICAFYRFAKEISDFLNQF